MKYASNTFILLITLLLSACYTGDPAQNERWKVAYKHDGEGKAIQGSKEKLFSAIRAGKTVRIGWGWYNEDRNLSIEHLADPIWLAIIDQKEVIAHLEPQVLSGIDWTTGTASYADSALLNQEWRVVINTNGSFDAVWYNRKEGEISRRAPQKHLLTWFVDELPAEKTKALFENK